MARRCTFASPPSTSIRKASFMICAAWPRSAATRSSSPMKTGSLAPRLNVPGLDQMLADARHGKFDVLLVWAFDRLARSVRHFLETLDELTHLQIEFISRFQREYRHGRPAGPCHVGHHQGNARVGTLFDHRTGARRHAKGQVGRPAARTTAAQCGSRSPHAKTADVARA